MTRSPQEAVATRVGHKAPHGPGLLLGGPAEQVPGGEPSPASCEIGSTVRGVEQGAEGVGAHGVGDLAVSGSVLPGKQPPGPNEHLATVDFARGGSRT